MTWNNCSRCSEPGVIHYNGQHYCSQSCLEAALRQVQVDGRESRSRVQEARSRAQITRENLLWVGLTLVLLASMVMAKGEVQDQQNALRIEAKDRGQQ